VARWPNGSLILSPFRGQVITARTPLVAPVISAGPETVEDRGGPLSMILGLVHYSHHWLLDLWKARISAVDP
jgi:hypothetical protein